ncbi:MAG: hypothetical protein KIT45_12630 [Fimbriimonadia bacterium]|nr:hypothetical protein [Fimbriimonadia bacterium]
MDNSFCSLWKELFKKRRKLIKFANSMCIEPDKLELELRIKNIENKLKKSEELIREELEFEKELQKTILEVERGKKQES